MQTVQQILGGCNSRLLFEYEIRLSEAKQLACKLKNQLKAFLAEMMHKERKDPVRLEQLKEHDRVLSQYELEEECRENVFEWIRDFKDFEIREAFKQQIKTLSRQVEMRD